MGSGMNLRTTTLAPLGAIAFFVVLVGGSAQATDRYDALQREALGAVDALFAAMASHDVDASRRLLLPGTRFVVVLPDGTLKTETDAGYLETLGKHREAFRERIWNAQVTVQGNLAQVWAPYDFHLDGKLSHCGIDSFSLVRGGDGWRIAGVSYTVQKTGCTPSPLGKVK